MSEEEPKTETDNEENENKNDDIKTNNNNKKSCPYSLYLVCKSDILIHQGSNPLEPLNKNHDFFVGDIFQGRISTQYNKFIQLREGSKSKKKQWIDTTEKVENVSVMKIFSPNINEYFHLKIGEKSTQKCKYLNKFLTKIIDELYNIFLGQDSISNIIITYLPFSYPIFTANGTLFRGRGHFTQFCVPYFHSKNQCKEYLRRIAKLRKKINDSFNNNNNDDDNKENQQRLDLQYEKKLMLLYKENMNFEKNNDKNNNDDGNDDGDDDEDDEEFKYREEILDEEYLNDIVSVQKGNLPKWIESIYQSIPSLNSYYYCAELYFITNENMVPFKKDEYLEQNKHPLFEIQHNNDNNNNNGIWKDKPILKAIKTGSTLSDIISINEVGGSRWFDIEFDPNDALNDDECQIFDDSVGIFRCKVGGKWQGDSRSRHYIDVKDENGDIFDKYLPMIVINMVI